MQMTKKQICLSPMILLFVSACNIIPQSSAPGTNIATQNPTHVATNQCYAKMQQNLVVFQSLPDLNDTGRCGWINAVKLMDFGTEATNLGAMTCPLAANFSAWAQYAVQPAAQAYLGSAVKQIETMGSYNCRHIAGSQAMSQHSFGNAVDVSGFVLTDGRHITILADWRDGKKSEKQFLRRIRQSACKRFSVVLSPDFNQAHANHLHFDMTPRNSEKPAYCR
jgi:hypothetical protein